jgi:RNA polymerase sigma-70 factor (ECF subfamily)
VAGFRTGEPAAVRAVYDRYAAAVLTIALNVLGDRQLAEDAVQITFVKAWRAAATVDESRMLAPWLYTIARRVAIDLYRGNRRPAPASHRNDYRSASSPPSFERVWEVRQITLAVNALPAGEREIVRGQHYLGLSHAEIADRLGIPIGTVKSRSHRAHRRLAIRLQHLAAVAS